VGEEEDHGPAAARSSPTPRSMRVTPPRLAWVVGRLVPLLVLRRAGAVAAAATAE
jgi:hypothetical protein